MGLAGSSAIITATMRALMQFFGIEIPNETLPSVILAAEVEELGINAGLQDRVIQVYEGCVFMDFNKKVMKQKRRGDYERIDPKLLPNLFIAYKTDLGKVSGRVLNDMHVRYHKGEKLVVDSLNEIADLAEQGKQALLEKKPDQLFDLMNRNFDLRSKVMNITERNLELVQTARKCGACAKFSGSGGSVIGIYKNDEMLTRLIVELEKIHARVIKPYIL